VEVVVMEVVMAVLAMAMAAMAGLEVGVHQEMETVMAAAMEILEGMISYPVYALRNLSGFVFF